MREDLEEVEQGPAVQGNLVVISKTNGQIADMILVNQIEATEEVGIEILICRILNGMIGHVNTLYRMSPTFILPQVHLLSQQPKLIAVNKVSCGFIIITLLNYGIFTMKLVYY